MAEVHSTKRECVSVAGAWWSWEVQGSEVVALHFVLFAVHVRRAYWQL